MDTDFIYYSLSTIPQVVGAIIAVLGAFILAYVENQNIKLDGEGQTFFDKARDLVEEDKKKLADFKKAKFTRRYRAMLAEMIKFMQNNKDVEELQESKDHFEEKLEKRDKVIKLFKRLFCLATVIIVLSLIFLSLTSNLTNDCINFFEYVIYALIVLTAVFLALLTSNLFSYLK